MNSSYFHHRYNSGTWLWLLFLLGALAHSLAAGNNHLVHNLLSDLPGVADQMDEQLINPWDFSSFNTCTPVGSPMCVPPNVASVLIAANGTQSIAQFTPIPGVLQPSSYPFVAPGITGIMPAVNGLSQPGTGGLAAGLLFCSQGGTIVGLGVFLPAFTTTLVDNSKSGAVYKGCTTGGLAQGNGVPTYYAANFNSGGIDMWDSNLNPVQRAACGRLRRSRDSAKLCPVQYSGDQQQSSRCHLRTAGCDPKQ